MVCINSINTCASGDSPLAQLVKELDLGLFLCVIGKLLGGNETVPINNTVRSSQCEHYIMQIMHLHIAC